MRKLLTAALLGSSLALAACGDADDAATDATTADDSAMAPAPADTTATPDATDTAAPDTTEPAPADTAAGEGDDY